MKVEKLKSMPNLLYCLEFLNNAGEKTRAIRLCMDVTGMKYKTSKRMVENLSYNRRNPDV